MNTDDISRMQLLREQAKARLGQALEPPGELSQEELRELVHDYQVHQIELELQNEELRNILLKLQETKDQLALARDRYARLFDEAPVGYLVVDSNEVIVQANQTFADMVGEEAYRLHGVGFADYILPADRGAFHGRFRAFFKHPEGKELDFRLIGMNGELHVRCTAKDESESPTSATGEPWKRILLLVQDVSSRVQAEKALRNSEQQYRELYEHAPVGIFESTPEGRYLGLNSEYARIAGYTSPEAMMARISDIAGQLYVHPEHHAHFNRMLKKEGYVNNGETELKRPNETTFWVSMDIRAKRDEQGNIIHFGFLTDITERKKAEEALRESEKTFRNIIQSSPMAIHLYHLRNDELIFLGANPAADKMLDVVHSRFVGQTIEQAFPALKETELSVRYRRAAQLGESWQTEKIDYDHEGAISGAYEVHAFQMSPNKAAVLLNDITVRKQAELEREKLQAQLLQAQKMESVGILAGGVAHDFNNLLQAMSGNIEQLLKDAPDDSPATIRLRTIARSVERGAQLVRQLLLFSRKGGTARIPVDLNQEIQNVVRILERTVPKMIALETHLDPSTWPISGDPVQIEQVLLNLANNSVGAMPDGGRLIIKTGNVKLNQDFIRHHPGAKPGAHALLTVSDTGQGIHAPTLKHVFDPFFTTKEVGQGTGLGLASVYGIVKAHDGYIHCSSKPGQGTTFQIYLPSAEGFEPGPSKPLKTTTAPEIERAETQGGQTILAVDDEREIRELTQEALEDLGYTVHCAANGEEALNLYREYGQTIDLVLLDLNMPGMGGHKCLKELLRLDPAVRVLITSGYSANGQAKETLDAGATGFIGKPYQLKELEAAARMALRKE